jgi:ribosomal protein S18 acetylase RimI-like enzyme
MALKVRAFKNEDFWQVEDLVRQFMDNDPFSPPILVRQMQVLFSPFFLVAVDNNIQREEIQGYIMGGIEFENKNVGWVLGLFVKEKFRNKGIGSEMLNTLIITMKNHGICEIKLTVDPQNVLGLKTYHKNGFEETDCMNEYYRKDKKVYLMKWRL